MLVWARDAGVELRRLDVRGASLEEAFLRIAQDAKGSAGEPDREKEMAV